MPWWTVPDKATGATYTEEMWDKYDRDNNNYLARVAYEEFVAPVSITATTEATSTVVIAGSPIVYEAVPHKIEFFAPYCSPGAAGAGGLVVCLFDGTSIGRFTPINLESAARTIPLKLEREFTPTAASHTYSIRAFVPSGTGSLGAGAGGVGNYFPGFLKITRVPT